MNSQTDKDLNSGTPFQNHPLSLEITKLGVPLVSTTYM